MGCIGVKDRLQPTILFITIGFREGRMPDWNVILHLLTLVLLGARGVPAGTVEDSNQGSRGRGRQGSHSRPSLARGTGSRAPEKQGLGTTGASLQKLWSTLEGAPAARDLRPHENRQQSGARSVHKADRMVLLRMWRAVTHAASSRFLLRIAGSASDHVQHPSW